MKRVITGLSLLLLLLCGATAQSISQYEYWTDDDYANRKASIATGSDISRNVRTATQKAGIHFLNFRAYRDDGVWGNFHRYLYYIPVTTQKSAASGDVKVEYWLDDNLTGSKNEKASGGNLSLTVDVSALTPGVHYFNCTPIDAEGERGASERYLFYVPYSFDKTATSSIKGIEYWIDDNYASKKIDQSGLQNPVFTIDIGGLTSGVHYFNCRVYNDRGEYGDFVRELFYIPVTKASGDTKLASYEYWLDDDYAHCVKGNSTNTEQTFTIDVSQLSSGVHYFNYWPIDDQGQRGNVIRQLFYMAKVAQSASEEIEYEYWIDADTEHKVTGKGQTGELAFNIDVSTLEMGSHTFNFRAKDILEQWGDTFVENFTISTEPQEVVTITANDITMEYGDEVPELTYTVTGGELNGKPKLTTTATKTSAVGVYSISIEKGTVTNEHFKLVPGTLTITKAPLIVTAKSYTKVEGEDNPAFEIIYSGWKNNETEAVLNKKPTATTTANVQSPPGTYPITVSGGEAANYSFTYVSGTLTIKSKIPLTTYTLSVSAKGNGSVSYDGTTVRSKTSSFTVEEGTNATILFTPDNGYRIKSLKVNNSDVTKDILNNQYTVSNITSNTIVEVEFEAIPSTTYNLSIKASGNGSASYNGTTIRSKTSNFTVNEGAYATVTFSPDEGHRILSVKVDDVDVTTYVSNSSYTISNIYKDTSLEVAFIEDLKNFTSDGVNYIVSSYDDKTVIVGKGDYGKVIKVPAEVTYKDIKWKVAGIEKAVLENNTELAAVIWNPTAEFTLDVSNPNFLLYVTSASYAPSSIKNVIVNNTADKIVLSDVANGNDFYCPIDFTAKSISYSHNYMMMTGIGESRGWETIALPFDVQKITHSSKGDITPFANWKSGDSQKPFWLKTYGTGGWADAYSIKANTPYIISMPNHSDYKSEFRLNGIITFSSENVTVKKSDEFQTGSHDGKTFVPCYSNIDNNSYYALNVNNDYVTYNGGASEGSRFILGLRAVHPFEAYMTSSSSAARTIAISENMATGVEEIAALIDENKGIRIYNLKGQLVIAEMGQGLDEIKKKLPAGVYIVNGKKLIIK